MTEQTQQPIDCLISDFARQQSVRVNPKRVRADVRVGDLLAKTMNGWYYPMDTLESGTWGIAANRR